MQRLNKITLLVLALNSGAMFAGTMGPVCNSVNVTLPCESTGWSLGAKALYLKPSLNSHSGFNPVLPFIYEHANTVVSPEYSWGFELEAAYNYSNGYDVDVNWYHLKHSTNSVLGTMVLANNTDIFGNVNTSTINSGTSSLSPRWDAVNLELGQHTNFGTQKAIRYHGGVQYSSLANTRARTLNTTSVVALTNAVNNHTSVYSPSYKGVGPRVGMDMSYGLGNGFGVYANGATALLAGNRAYNYTYTDNIGNSFAFNRSTTAVVPELDAKLGLTYTYAMAAGSLTLDAGWMWVDYINAHSNLQATNYDVSMQGLDFGLRWHGDLA